MKSDPLPFEEIHRVARLHRLRVLDAPPEPALDALVALASATTGLPIAVLSLLDAERQWLQAARGVPATRSLPRAGSFCEQAIAAHAWLEVEDARADARFATCPLVRGEARAAHCVAVPIVLPEGERVGALCVLSPQPGRLDAPARAQLDMLARALVHVLLLRQRERELAHERAADLPRRDASAAAAPVNPRAHVSAAPATASRTSVVPQSASLLLVEDNPVNQVVARGLLAGLGYTRITLAVNGLEALQACERAAFDLVLMDCQMPEMDGLRATQILRERGVKTPIVALTASTVSGDRERCLGAGMNDYLAKPVDAAMLADKLRRWLAGAQPVAAPARAPQPRSAAFDRGALQERFFDDVTLFDECRVIFLRQAPGSIEELRRCLATGDAARARYLAHTLKGSAATIGAQRLADCCQAMEQALDAQAGSGVAVAADWLAHAGPALSDFVDASADLSGSRA